MRRGRGRVVRDGVVIGRHRGRKCVCRGSEREAALAVSPREVRSGWFVWVVVEDRRRLQGHNKAGNADVCWLGGDVEESRRAAVSGNWRLQRSNCEDSELRRRVVELKRVEWVSEMVSRWAQRGRRRFNVGRVGLEEASGEEERLGGRSIRRAAERDKQRARRPSERPSWQHVSSPSHHLLHSPRHGISAGPA